MIRLTSPPLSPYAPLAIRSNKHSHTPQSSGYAYPFEVRHSSYFGPDLPAYWIRLKGGVAPGYFSTIALMPEIKTGTSLACVDTSWPFATPFCVPDAVARLKL